ncbi:MAG TPA: hypothetical protein VMU89_25265 [Thermomicrobiaceae bacterium]|nr:hypothetical protein [Thermomicrobiaceae bacterium]
MPSSHGGRLGSLAHVLWIGGPPDCGKTSIAARLAERHGLQVYHFDRHEPEHFARADPARHPALHAAHPDRMGPEERWVGSQPDAMARDTIASWTERFDMALDDLRAMPSSPPIVAEGPGLFPDCVLPFIADARQAIWLVPSDDFKRASVLRRGKPGARHETSDPERAQRNLIARDLIMGAYVRRRAAALGLILVEVDGSRNLDEMATLVEQHFAPGLPGEHA